MKKYVVLLSLTLMSFLSARADLIWYEGFNYADGAIITNSAVWARHSGSATGGDSLVKNHKLELSATISGTTTVPLSRQDDINRKLAVAAGSPYTNSATTPVIYASFTINATNFPNAAGTYITHFINGSSTFYGKVHALSNSAALPNTFRLGVANGANAANLVFPVDLATNTDYQVVIGYDQPNQAAKMWVNPIGPIETPLAPIDGGNAAQIQGFAIRQAGSFGNFFCTFSNMAVATTYDEAATNVWSTNAVAPVIVYGLKNTTNFVGDSAILYVVANGQGLDQLTYQWRKNGTPITNPAGNTNVLAFSSAQITDSGSYDVIVTTPYGLSVTAPAKFFNVSNAPIPPTIVSGPSNTTVYAHGNVTFHAVASGPPTISYQWYLNNAPLSDGANFSGTGSDTLAITDITSVDGTTGNYKVVASNPYGSATSLVATVTVTNAAAVSVAYLRSLMDSNFAATNTTTFYQVTGHVTTFTNLTSGNTSSYYLQDGSGDGINIFATLASSFRPQLGDVVTWVGPLANFQGNIELSADASNPSTSYTVLSNDVAGLPAAKVIPYNAVTNNMQFTMTNLVGSVVMLTNVYFTNSAIPITGATSTSTTVTNTSGQNFSLFFSAQDLDTQGQTLPDFAWSVIGILTINTNNALNKGLAVTVTHFTDIVTNAPAAVSISTAHTGNSTTLSWTAVPYNYSYSVSASTSVLGPYAPLATGLVFTNSNGTYKDNAASGPQKFYRVTTP
jgi:hypothetical protein